MEKSRLYTGGGDKGETSLVGGQRVAKDSLRLETYGTVDEFSALLGRLHAANGIPDEVKGQLLQVQNLLFDIGAYLATDPDGGQPQCNAVTDDKIRQLEGWIDALDEQTPKIRAFVLPGGSQASAEAHVARTVCRRAERRLIALDRDSYVDPRVLRYFNRLSDYLFIAARYLNFMQGVDELVWSPAH